MASSSNIQQPQSALLPAPLKRLLATPKELGTLPHWWLVFLGFFVVPMIGMPMDEPEFWLCIAGVVAFLPVYYAAFRRNGRAMYIPIGAISLLGMLFTPINFGSNVFFHYAAFLAGQAMAPRRALLVVGLMCLWMVAATYALDLPAYYLYPGTLVALGLVGISINTRRHELANSALKRSREEVHRLGQMAERERIARDLHDVLGHTLSVITLKAELAGKLINTDPAKAERELAQLAATSREALASVRETVGNYRRVGLVDELTSARAALKRANVALTDDIEPIDLSPRHETLLALIAREAVTNVIRHADAARCHIELKRDQGEIHFSVTDDGVGFDGGEGQGMTGMRERLAVLGGELSIESRGGTQLSIRLPEHLTPA